MTSVGGARAAAAEHQQGSCWDGVEVRVCARPGGKQSRARGRSGGVARGSVLRIRRIRIGWQLRSTRRSCAAQGPGQWARRVQTGYGRRTTAMAATRLFRPAQALRPNSGPARPIPKLRTIPPTHLLTYPQPHTPVHRPGAAGGGRLRRASWRPSGCEPAGDAARPAHLRGRPAAHRHGAVHQQLLQPRAGGHWGEHGGARCGGGGGRRGDTVGQEWQGTGLQGHRIEGGQEWRSGLAGGERGRGPEPGMWESRLGAVGGGSLVGRRRLGGERRGGEGACVGCQHVGVAGVGMARAQGTWGNADWSDMG